jgi:NitT/TauT family transport system substrate-binding protein
MVRALQWLSTASAEDILKVIPPEYTLGDKGTYLAALERSRPGYSKDGLIPHRARRRSIRYSRA